MPGTAELRCDYEATAMRVRGRLVKLRRKNAEKVGAWIWGRPSPSAELALNYYFPDFLVRQLHAFHFKTAVIKVLLFVAESIPIQVFILLL